MIPHNKLTFDKKEGEAVQKIVNSGYWAGGKEVQKLEKKIAKITNRQYAIGVSSGLSALRLALLALKIDKGDEVIVPAYCCVAIPNAVLSCGAIPIPVDVAPNNWNIDIKNIQPRVTAKTKAIIAINTFGSKANIEEISSLGIPVVEDCAHAIGDINNYTYGKQGIISIGSFYATKLIGGGEGGVVMTDDKDIADFIFDYRDYTDKQPSGLRLNEKMSNIDAALTLCQINKLRSFISKRQAVADTYNKNFSKLRGSFPDLRIPVAEDRIWYRYTISTQKVKASVILKALEANNVSARMPVENWLGPQKIMDHPNANFAYQHIVSLPIYPGLKKDEIDTVVGAVKKTMKKLFIE